MAAGKFENPRNRNIGKSSGGPFARKLGKRATKRPIAIFPSIRANVAPKHIWCPLANAT